MGYTDKIFTKLISKKFFVFLLATILLFMKVITNDQWFLITMLWMGGVSLIDAVAKFKK